MAESISGENATKKAVFPAACSDASEKTAFFGSTVVLVVHFDQLSDRGAFDVCFVAA
jgi:hypothetical protein